MCGETLRFACMISPSFSLYVSLVYHSAESMQKPKDINAVVEEKNHIPKRWLKYHYIPSKSVMESKRRWVCMQYFY